MIFYNFSSTGDAGLGFDVGNGRSSFWLDGVNEVDGPWNDKKKLKFWRNVDENDEFRCDFDGFVFY